MNFLGRSGDFSAFYQNLHGFMSCTNFQVLLSITASLENETRFRMYMVPAVLSFESNYRHVTDSTHTFQYTSVNIQP
jgi:hypothetical protein